MQVSDFIKTVAQHPERPFLFEYAPGTVVQGGYHVTEIKSATFETIDCGNSLHTWKEVVVQVWVPAEAQPIDPWMPTDKFLQIWDIVDSRLALPQEAEIRIEFGDGQTLTANYHVDGLVATKDGLVVQMAPPRTMCKPREILVPLNAGAAAISQTEDAASLRQETVLPLPVRALANGESACCSPAHDTGASCCG